MITEGAVAPDRSGTPRPRVPRGRELLSLFAVTGALEALGTGARLALRYDRDRVLSGEWWRLVTAHLVHLGWDHWALNMAGLAGLWWLYVERASRRQWLIVSLACALVIGLALLVGSPEVGWYVGLSGVLHGLWAAAAVAMWRHSRTESVCAGALLAGKLALEYLYGPLSSAGGAGLPVVTVAHRYGALGGVLGAGALKLWRKSL